MSLLVLEIAPKALAVWFGILVLAIANGAFREAVPIPALGKSPGLILSGGFLYGLVVAVAYATLPWFGRAPAAIYTAIGFAWLCLTLMFEFVFGHLIQGKTWSQLLDAYTFKDGNIWSVVVLVIMFAPYVAAKIKGWA